MILLMILQPIDAFRKDQEYDHDQEHDRELTEAKCPVR